LSLITMIWLQGSVVFAYSTEECAAAYESAQMLRRERKLTETRTKLLVCAHSSCPTAVTRDCVTWLSEVEREIPTVVLGIQNEAGNDVVGATVWLDGNETPVDWVGKAMTMDPGRHTVKISADGYDGMEQEIAAREGERSRVIAFKLKAIAPLEPAATQTDTQEPEAKPGPRRWPLYTLIGVAGAAAIGGVVLGVMGNSDTDRLKKRCDGNCLQSEVNIARGKLIAADAAFGVAGAAAIAAGVVWWLGRKREKTQANGDKPLAKLKLSPSLSPTFGGAMATLRASY
jgi:hypothetical protein